MIPLVLLLAVALQSDAALPRPLPEGQILYDYRCKSCHEPGQPGVPDKAVLARMKPAAIVRSLERGEMKVMGSTLTSDEKRLVAAFITGTAP